MQYEVPSKCLGVVWAYFEALMYVNYLKAS